MLGSNAGHIASNHFTSIVPGIRAADVRHVGVQRVEQLAIPLALDLEAGSCPSRVRKPPADGRSGPRYAPVMPDVTVSRTIAATPSAVWKLVSDPTRMGEWSPENQGAKWLGDAKDASVGAKFRGSNKNGWVRWKTVCTVSECSEDEAFAFNVKSGPIPVATWAFRLSPDGEGTKVTEEFTNSEPRWMEKFTNKLLKIDSRAEFNREGMGATLAAMAVELEAAS